MRIARIALLTAALSILCGGTAAYAVWPWSQTESAKPVSATSKSSQPSTLSKMGTSTKNFFGGMLGTKKPEPKKNAPYSPYAPAVKKKDPKKESLLSSWFGPKETPPPQSTNDWMKLKPIRPTSSAKEKDSR